MLAISIFSTHCRNPSYEQFTEKLEICKTIIENNHPELIEKIDLSKSIGPIEQLMKLFSLFGDQKPLIENFRIIRNICAEHIKRTFDQDPNQDFLINELDNILKLIVLGALSVLITDSFFKKLLQECYFNNHLYKEICQFAASCNSSYYDIVFRSQTASDFLYKSKNLSTPKINIEKISFMTTKKFTSLQIYFMKFDISEAMERVLKKYDLPNNITYANLEFFTKISRSMTKNQIIQYLLFLPYPSKKVNKNILELGKSMSIDYVFFPNVNSKLIDLYLDNIQSESVEKLFLNLFPQLKKIFSEQKRKKEMILIIFRIISIYICFIHLENSSDIINQILENLKTLGS